MKKFKFRGHETFFIRKGWISKGIKNVKKDPHVFMGKNSESIDTLGMGSNMVKSLRYWLQAVGVTTENTSGKRKQTLTKFGEIIDYYDKYIEEMGTLWLLHYKLATNKEEATAWYFFFNVFMNVEFNREDFIIKLKDFIRENGQKEVSERALEDDYNCILNTYISKTRMREGKIEPENNIDCPLGELKLLDISNKKDKIYKKSFIKQTDIHPLIVLSVIIDQRKEEETEIKISSLQNDEKNVCKIFKLDIINLLNILYKLEKMRYINVVRTAGLDVIRLKKNISFLECVEKYYKNINNIENTEME